MVTQLLYFNDCFSTFPFFSRDVDWECEKRLYLESVKKHLSWNQAGRQGRTLFQLQSLFQNFKNSYLLGVLTELLDLMSQTARSSGSWASQPQHPSDLTRRYAASAVSRALSFWLSNRLIWSLLVGTTEDA